MNNQIYFMVGAIIVFILSMIGLTINLFFAFKRGDIKGKNRGNIFNIFLNNFKGG